MCVSLQFINTKCKGETNTGAAKMHGFSCPSRDAPTAPLSMYFAPGMRNNIRPASLRQPDLEQPNKNKDHHNKKKDPNSEKQHNH